MVQYKFSSTTKGSKNDNKGSSSARGEGKGSGKSSLLADVQCQKPSKPMDHGKGGTVSNSKVAEQGATITGPTDLATRRAGKKQVSSFQIASRGNVTEAATASVDSNNRDNNKSRQVMNKSTTSSAQPQHCLNNIINQLRAHAAKASIAESPSRGGPKSYPPVPNIDKDTMIVDQEQQMNQSQDGDNNYDARMVEDIGSARHHIRAC